MERFHYYSFLCTLHYSRQFCLLWVEHFEFIQRCLKVIHKRLPLLVGYYQMPMSVTY